MWSNGVSNEAWSRAVVVVAVAVGREWWSSTTEDGVSAGTKRVWVSIRIYKSSWVIVVFPWSVAARSSHSPVAKLGGSEVRRYIPAA